MEKGFLFICGLWHLDILTFREVFYDEGESLLNLPNEQLPSAL